MQQPDMAYIPQGVHSKTSFIFDNFLQLVIIKFRRCKTLFFIFLGQEGMVAPYIQQGKNVRLPN